MLKRVIEDDHIDSVSDRLPNPASAVGRCDYRNPLVQALVYNGFVAAVAP
jgi:hypothetical protein